MRGVATLVGAAVLGAVAYYGISQLFEGEDGVQASGEGAGTPDGVSAKGEGARDGVGTAKQGSRSGSAGGSPALVSVEDGNSKEGDSTGVETSEALEGSGARLVEDGPTDPVLRPAVAPKFFGGAPPEPSEVEPFTPLMPDTGPDPELIRSIEQDLRQARTRFAAGHEEEGMLLVKQIYAVSKDIPGVDLTAEVARVLRVEEEPAKRREYARYIARRDASGNKFEIQMLACRKLLAIADTSPEAAEKTWQALTVAYWLAGTRERKEQVLALLNPFIDSMVFSGRFTHLVKSYNIQPGDSLSTIAAKFQTTSDSIRRINKLTTDVIQPRHRLRVLPGEAEVFVDKDAYALSLLIDGRILREFRVGLGVGDATPEGEFVVDVRQKDPTWWRQGRSALPAGHPDNVLGTRWLGFKETDEQGGIGIHGTNDPTELGKESSAGCVRMRKDDVELLYDFVGYGTRVTIE